MIMMILWAGSTTNAKYSGGMGEPNDPYKIATAEDLNDIGNHEEDFDKHFILVNDVNLAAYTGTQFKIIGNSTTMFIGIFDGNDHKVWNFTWASTGRDYIGLFGRVGSSGQIKNLGMENVDVDAGNGNWASGLVGFNQGGTITNCYSKVNITGREVSGLVVETRSGSITNCYSTGSVTGLFVGGLVASNMGGQITNSYSTASVSGNAWAGGLVVVNCGTISNCYSTSSVSGGEYVGGLVGWNYVNGKINSSYSTGSVSGESYVGGLVGSNFGFGNDKSKITNCYSTGSVSGDEYVGGLVGGNSGSVSASFWDTQTSGQLTSEGGTPKTTAEMKTKSTFTNAGWDFVNIWDICEGTNYPKLRWQIPPIGDFVCPDGVDFLDFAVLASAWQSDPSQPNWLPAYDISEPKDSFIDELDLTILCESWLEGK
jgi:hypothetical protein